MTRFVRSSRFLASSSTCSRPPEDRRAQGSPDSCNARSSALAPVSSESRPRQLPSPRVGCRRRGVRHRDPGADLRPALDLRLHRARRRLDRVRARPCYGDEHADDRAPLRGAARRSAQRHRQSPRRLRGAARTGRGGVISSPRPVAWASVRDCSLSAGSGLRCDDVRGPKQSLQVGPLRKESQ